MHNMILNCYKKCNHISSFTLIYRKIVDFHTSLLLYRVFQSLFPSTTLFLSLIYCFLENIVVILHNLYSYSRNYNSGRNLQSTLNVIHALPIVSSQIYRIYRGCNEVLGKIYSVPSLLW